MQAPVTFTMMYHLYTLINEDLREAFVTASFARLVWYEDTCTVCVARA
jgi:hypothetical protein